MHRVSKTIGLAVFNLNLFTINLLVLRYIRATVLSDLLFNFTQTLQNFLSELMSLLFCKFAFHLVFTKNAVNEFLLSNCFFACFHLINFCSLFGLVVKLIACVNHHDICLNTSVNSLVFKVWIQNFFSLFLELSVVLQFFNFCQWVSAMAD